MPLAVFAVLAVVNEIVGITVFNEAIMPLGGSYVWALYPLAFGGIWLALRTRENKTGVRAQSNAWGWVALALAISFFPIGLFITFWGFGAVIVAIALMVIAGVQRNGFLIRSSAALLAAAILTPLLGYGIIAFRLDNLPTTNTCSVSTALTTTGDGPDGNDISVTTPSPDGNTSVACSSGSGVPNITAYDIAAGLILPITFTAIVAAAWRREHIAPSVKR